MTSEQTVTHLNDAALVRFITAASERLVFAAPGLRQEVAEALGDAFLRLPGNVMVTLDFDAEVCRLGYGDLSGLLWVQAAAEKAGIRLHHQSGLRLGLLISDTTTLIYSPIPRSIEASPELNLHTNGLLLQGAVPDAIERACGLGEVGDEARQIGMEFATRKTMELLQENLNAFPGRSSIAAQVERRFAAAFQFVEFEVKGYQLGIRAMKLDTEWFALTDPFLRERVEITLKPFKEASFLQVEIPKLSPTGKEIPGVTETFGPATILRDHAQLKKEFLFEIPEVGTVIRCVNKKEFEFGVELLNAKLRLYSEAINKSLNHHVNEAKAKLKTSLIDELVKRHPPAWRKYMDGNTLSPSMASMLMDDTLNKLFTLMAREFNPSVRLIYKDATCETIRDQGFRKSLEKHFGCDRAAHLFQQIDSKL